VFINTKARLRKVYVANPVILETYTADPNQIIVTAKAPGVSTVVLWDEDGQSKTYMISSDINVEDLDAAFKQSLSTSKIQVEGTEGRVILKGTVSNAAALDSALKLASLYSKDVASSLSINPADVKQVWLKVRIVEVDRAKLTQFGLNFMSALGKVTSGTTTSQFPSTTTVGLPTLGSDAKSYSTVSASDPLNFFLYSTQLNIGVTIKDLENKQILQILAEPTIVTLSGEKANFLAGGEFPFPVVQGGTGGLNSISVQFRPYGVKVEFTPYVNDDGTIALKIAPEVSALDYANAAVISGYTIPAIATRRADTQVLLRSGQSFAISGLLDRRTTDSLQRTPGAANLPIIGQLFRSKSLNHSVNELVVIVTPTTIDPLTDKSVPELPTPVIPVGLDKVPFDKKFTEPHTER
jgi:pilus assembly protein CpaC